MAQMDGMRHSGKSTADRHLIHGGGDSHVSHGTSSQGHSTYLGMSTSSRGSDGEHHEKKSVLHKVKEKAHKWKHLLQKKKHGNRGSNLNSSSSSQAVRMAAKPSEEKDGRDEADPEFHGAAKFESEMAREVYRDAATKEISPRKVTIVEGKQPTRAAPTTPNSTPDLNPTTTPTSTPISISTNLTTANTSESALFDKDVGEDNHKVETAPSEPSTGEAVPASNKHSTAETTTTTTTPGGCTKTVTETVTHMLAPAYTMVSEAKTKITSSIPHIPLLSPRDEAVAKQVWDKGVSVKEYLWQKLEPGDDDRALSQLITETIGSSPRAGGTGDNAEGGVVERVKGAFSSLLGMEHGTTAMTPATTNMSTSTVARTGSFPGSSHRTRFPPAPLKVSHSFTPSTRANNNSTPASTSSGSGSGSSNPTLVTSRTMPRSLTSRKPYPNSVAALNNLSGGSTKLSKCTTVPRGALVPPRTGEIEETGEKTLQEYLLRL